MNEMSRKSTAEYIAAKRKRYLCACKDKRSQILDDVQVNTFALGGGGPSESFF